jgi:CRP-like cAMP-binding protein
MRSVKVAVCSVTYISVEHWQIQGSAYKTLLALLRGPQFANFFPFQFLCTKRVSIAVLKRRLRVVKAGERTNPGGKPIANRILLMIPEHEFRRLRPALEMLDLPQRLSLYEPNRKIKYVYFPNGGLISLVIETADGKTVEVGVLGREGLAGIPAIFGLNRSPIREIVQIACETGGFRMLVEEFRNALTKSPILRATVGRYSAVLGMQVAQTAACNRLHDVEKRFARWLLIAQDRVDGGTISITHDFLATMLGTDRPSVSLAAAGLQRQGIIDYARGAVKVLNRKALEASACECYQVIQQFNGEIDLR